MAYVVPQALVFQEFNLIPAEITNPLRACIFGGLADLHRYAESDEKLTINLGSYDPDSATDYAWPGKDAGSVVDVSYAKVFIDDAYLMFFEDMIGTDSTIAPIAGYNNKIRSNTVAFEDNGSSYPRAAALLRDVKAGDRVYVRGVDSSTVSHELNTYVKDIEGEAIAATIGTPYPGTGNSATQVASVVATNTEDMDASVVPTLNVDAAAYDGLTDGFINETYTIEITKGSVSADFTTAEFKITSASGEDDELGIVPVASGSDVAAGSRGLEIGWTLASSENLLAGQKWSVVLADAFEASLARSGGTYTGTSDTTYIIEVVEGGAFTSTSAPKIQVSTTTGIDSAAAVVVTDDRTTPTGGQSVSTVVGTLGVTIRFGGTDGTSISSLGDDEYILDDLDGLRKGDKFFIAVTAATVGSMQTLVLAHNMNDDLQTATDLDVRLYMQKDIEVPQDRASAPPATNWDTAASEITINDGIDAYDAEWLDGGGDPVALPVKQGTVYVQFREWLVDRAGALHSLQDTAGIADLEGPLDPDNPLKWGVYKALSNSNGSLVKFASVEDPNELDDWADALALVVGRDDVYHLVPLTRTKAVQDLFEAHVNSESSATAGRWRVLWVSLDVDESIALVDDSTSSDGLVVEATLDDDPDASGTQYTLLEIATTNADLLALGVTSGDIVRFLYGSDGFGNESYTEFVVESVTNETELLLTAGHSVEIDVAVQVEIWHNRSKPELAAAIAADAGAWGNRRVRAVWPDDINSGGTLTAGFHLAAALAGLASGVAPHQGLTNLSISGFDDADRSREFFNADDLNTMANSGVWVVTQDDSGQIISRHALTSDVTDLNSKEEMVVRNVDSMSFLYLNRLAPFIGRTNVTPSALSLISVEVSAATDFLKANGYTDTLGSQLIDGSISQLRQHELLKDRVVIVLDLEIPYPMNNVEIHLVI